MRSGTDNSYHHSVLVDRVMIRHYAEVIPVVALQQMMATVTQVVVLYNTMMSAVVVLHNVVTPVEPIMPHESTGDSAMTRPGESRSSTQGYDQCYSYDEPNSPHWFILLFRVCFGNATGYPRARVGVT
ncbi:MAG: hypothetical protein JSU72_05440 [Deltaproteobacteria bacterium]|nr:MAG: hypothetical protein JSU72_05440 [Deltaproteobacteria bacterium]